MQEGLFPDLSESHRSRIRITLTFLDEALIKFEEWARGREVRSLLYTEENTLSSEERSGILAGIAGMRRIILELRDNLQLEVRPQNVTKSIQGHCCILWVDVLEMTGKYLRGFGEAPPELADYLDPKANQILEYLDHIKILLLKH
ncbi:MAG: hypothetical protein ACLP2P_12940 [Desulfobaccales bacterium]